MIYAEQLVPILLASALSAVLVGSHIVLLRRAKAETAGHVDLFASFAIYLAAYCGAALLISRGVPPLAQLVAGLSTAGFICLAYMQVFSQISRGFSLRVLVDVERCGGLDLEGILREYCDGRGAQWLLDKRVDGLVHWGLAKRHGDALAITDPKGRQVGNLGILLKRIIKPGQGG